MVMSAVQLKHLVLLTLSHLHLPLIGLNFFDDEMECVDSDEPEPKDPYATS
jgi:hypothetical protein